MEKLKILRKLSGNEYKIWNLNKNMAYFVRKGDKLNTQLVENQVYEVEIHKVFINKARLVRTLEKPKVFKY